MRKNEKETEEEKISCGLDRLNDGNCPVIADTEIEELIEMAALVKKTHQQEELPRVLIDEIVNNLAAELGEKKQKGRRQWLYGGLACAAATLLIAIGTQFLLPQSFDNNIAQEMDGSAEMKKNVAVVDQGSIPVPQSAKTTIEKQEEPISSEKIPIAVPSETTATKSTNSISEALVEIIQVAQPLPEEEKINQVAILEKEIPQEKIMEKNLVRARMNMNFSAQADKYSQTNTENAILVQPNKVAQSLTVDHSSGAIRQVYNEGLYEQEQIIITQRVLVGDSGVKAIESAKQDANKDNSKNSTAPAVYKTNKNHNNSLTVNIDKYSVTIEGNKTTEELKKIAESLVFKKIE